jgi:LacI family transcriptional regulator/LacI family purine nucleotide synthesis repressor
VLSTSSVTDRYLGYVRALMERNIPVREDWVIADRSRETLLLDEDVYFSLPEELPTAFVCNSDLAAGLLSRKLAHRGLLCPDDISIVGFDHFTELEEAIPFTTYAVDTKEMVRKAASLLLRRIHGDYCRKSVSIVEGRLIEQGSVKTLA